AALRCGDGQDQSIEAAVPSMASEKPRQGGDCAMISSDILILGAGIFGITAAIELNRRGHRVAVIDPGPIPHPLAASTDISKVVRMEYGPDRQYARMVDKAIDGFVQWNEAFGEELYHNTGVLMLTQAPM